MVLWRGKTLQYSTKYCPNPTSRDGQRYSLAYTYTGVATPHPPSTHRRWNLYSDSHPPPEETPTVKSQGRLNLSTYRIHSAPPSPVLPSSPICSITTAMTVALRPALHLLAEFCHPNHSQLIRSWRNLAYRARSNEKQKTGNRISPNTSPVIKGPFSHSYNRTSFSATKYSLQIASCFSVTIASFLSPANV